MPYSEWTRYLRGFSPESARQRPPEGLFCADRQAVAVDGWDGVGDEELARFREQGFLVVDGAFSAAEVQGAFDAIGALLDGAAPSYHPAPWGQRHGVLLRPDASLDTLSSANWLDVLVLARAMVEHEPRLTAMANHPGLERVLRHMMGDAPVLIHNMVRTKPPTMGDKPWHQDLTHFNVDPAFTVVTAWIALDDAPRESGCLHFLPGTHLGGPAKHVFGRDYQIPDADVPRVGQVATPVARGGCVLFNGLTHHGSPPNQSSVRRLALQLTFKPANARVISEEERILAFAGTASD